MKETIMSLFRQAGLSAYAEPFADLIRPSIRMYTEAAGEGELPVGTSRIGGIPDLPPDWSWPYRRDYPLSFIAQINLAELPPVAHESLPQQGILYFFYAAAAMYDDPDFYGDKDTAKVLYYSGDLADLSPRPEPPELHDYEMAVFSPCTLTYQVEWTVPPSESADIERLGMSWNINCEDYKRYWDLFLREHERLCIGPDDMKHRLLGHPDPIQGDMQKDAARIARGTKDGTAWRLLLQIDSEEEKTGMMWGDVGRIYFWIEKEALRNCDFTHVVCLEQCG